MLTLGMFCSSNANTKISKLSKIAGDNLAVKTSATKIWNHCVRLRRPLFLALERKMEFLILSVSKKKTIYFLLFVHASVATRSIRSIIWICHFFNFCPIFLSRFSTLCLIGPFCRNCPVCTIFNRNKFILALCWLKNSILFDTDKEERLVTLHSSSITNIRGGCTGCPNRFWIWENPKFARN